MMSIDREFYAELTEKVFKKRFLVRIKAVKRAWRKAKNPEWREFWRKTNNSLIENERARIERARNRKDNDSI